MAAVNYYIGFKRGDGANPYAAVIGTTTSGTAVDVELRIQINDGSTATGIKKIDVIRLAENIKQVLADSVFSGTNLPVL